jgi:hypothetical protein
MFAAGPVLAASLFDGVILHHHEQVLALFLGIY